MKLILTFKMFLARSLQIVTPIIFCQEKNIYFRQKLIIISFYLLIHSIILTVFIILFLFLNANHK